MKQGFIISEILLAVALLASLGLLSTEWLAIGQEKLVILAGDEPFVVTLGDLEIDQTKTYEQNGHTLTVTRQEEGYKVLLDGKEILGRTLLVSTTEDEKETCIVLKKLNMEQGDGDVEKQKEIKVKIIKEGEDSQFYIFKDGEEFTWEGDLEEIIHTSGKKGEETIVIADTLTLQETDEGMKMIMDGEELLLLEGEDGEDKLVEIIKKHKGPGKKHICKVMVSQDDDKVVIWRDGEKEVVKLSELAGKDGQTITAGDHEIKIWQDKDGTRLMLDGEELNLEELKKEGCNKRIKVIKRDKGKPCRKEDREEVVELAGDKPIQIMLKNDTLHLKAEGRTITLNEADFSQVAKRTYKLAGHEVVVRWIDGAFKAWIDGKPVQGL